MAVVPCTHCGRGIENRLMENQVVTSLKVSGTFLDRDQINAFAERAAYGKSAGTRGPAISILTVRMERRP